GPFTRASTRRALDPGACLQALLVAGDAGVHLLAHAPDAAVPEALEDAVGPGEAEEHGVDDAVRDDFLGEEHGAGLVLSADLPVRLELGPVAFSVDAAGFREEVAEEAAVELA